MEVNFHGRVFKFDSDMVNFEFHSSYFVWNSFVGSYGGNTGRPVRRLSLCSQDERKKPKLRQ